MKQAAVHYAARAAAIALLSIVVTGCQTELEPPQPVSDTGISSPGLAKPADSPQKIYNNTDNSSNPVVNTIVEEGVTDVPAAQTESSAAKNAPSSAKTESKWDSSSPKLHGIGVGDAQGATERKLGKPVDNYAIEDENETLTIHEYNGFSIGYGKDKAVRFIEVFSSDTATGLNGLRIGDTENAAIKALGKPDTHTASVISYKAAGALLKLDMDPDKDEIISIKLFLQTAPA